MTAQPSAFNAQPSVQLHIEELALHGFSAGDRFRIAKALQGELTRLLGNSVLPASLAAPREISRLDGGSFQVAANSKPEVIGAQVAQSLYRGTEAMNLQFQPRTKSPLQQAPSFPPASNRNRQSLLRHSRDSELETRNTAFAPSIVHEVLRSPGQPLDAPTRSFMEPRFGHDFSRVRVRETGTSAAFTQSVDGVSDEEEPAEQAPGEGFGPAKGDSFPMAREQGEPAGGPATGPAAPSGGPAPPPACPSSTQVEKLTDLTPAGLKAGYLTAYGSLATMRVLPDETNWNGTRIVESLSLDSGGTCPSGFTSKPCAGGPPFTVGDGTKGFSVLPAQPGQQNRFYDFHRTKSDISLLHDATHNPKGLNSCTMICNQSYSCAGTVIGKHTITRTFTKGTYNGTDVTLVSVTKT